MYFGGTVFVQEVTRRPRREFSFTECAHWMLPEVIPEVKIWRRCKIALNAAKNKPEGCLGHTECLPKPGRTGADRTLLEFSEENRRVVRKQTCNNSTRLACKRWSIFCRLSFRLLLESCNNFISRSLSCNFENGATAAPLRESWTDWLTSAPRTTHWPQHHGLPYGLLRGLPYGQAHGRP